jgi:hypothetical protein
MDTYSVQPVFYKITTVTYDVNGCLVVLPQCLQDTSPSGGILLCAIIADCMRYNANLEIFLAVLPTVGWMGVSL